MIQNTTETQALQRTFRNLMNAFARPGLLGDIEIMGGRGTTDALSGTSNTPISANPLPPCFEMVVRTLVDQAVIYAVRGSRCDEVSRFMALQTHSHEVPIAEAQYLLVPDLANSAYCREVISQANPGTLIAPEKGATVFVACSGLAGMRIPSEDTTDVLQDGVSYRVMIEGPGIKDTHTFFVDRIDWAEARKARSDEYPCGIDIILVDEAGHVVAIPRTTTIVEVQKDGAKWDM